MSSRYFYLELTCSADCNRLSVRSAIEEAAKSVFGECGAGCLCVDVLQAEGGRALLRVRAGQLRRVRAALSLGSLGGQHNQLRVARQAPALQALL